MAQQRQQQFCKLPGIAPRECKSLRRPHFASVVKLLSSSASNGEFAGGSPAGCTKFFGALAQQKRRPAQNGKVEGANPSRATNFAHVVQSRDGALKTRTVPVQVRPWAPAACSPIRRDVPLKTERLQVQVLPRGPFWNVNRTSEPGLLLNSACLVGCGASPRHSAIFACSSKRTGGFISRIALDQCRVRERYRTRAPICSALRALSAMPSLGKRISPVQFRVRDPIR